jgi:diguanylate cyclase (GGDEF)-like protein
MLTISALRDESGNFNQYVALFSDITEVKTYRDHLERQAHYDELTDLPNRVLLSDRLQHAVAGARRNATLMAVVALDLDGFKAINDTFGHEAGDRVLVETGKRILGTLRSNDTVARVGGDEFVLILADVTSDADCIRTLTRVLGHISKPISVGKGKFGSVTGSIGYTLFPEDDAQMDGLLRHADMAMYSSKQTGKNRVTRFDVNLDHRQRGFADAIIRLEKGLLNKEFQLYVQPKVDLRTGKAVGAEALLRWIHPIRGLIGPAEFLPLIADKKVLTLAFDEWVLQEGVRILAAWQAQGLDLPLSLNMSPFQLQSMEFAEKIMQALEAAPGLTTSHLEIEILESSALEDLPRAVELIAKCQSIGIRFALDDFGTGYSTLTYLKQMSVDTLKVDRSFIHDMEELASSKAIVKGIVAMADAFNCSVVAEGVENWTQARELLQMGCFIVQGFAVAKPMPAHEFPDWAATFLLPDLDGISP